MANKKTKKIIKSEPVEVESEIVSIREDLPEAPKKIEGVKQVNHDWYYFHRHDYKTCRVCGVKKSYGTENSLCEGKK